MSDETSIAQAQIDEAKAPSQVWKFLIRKRIQATLAGLIGPHPTRHRIVPADETAPAPRPQATPDLREPDVVDQMERLRESMRGGGR